MYTLLLKMIIRKRGIKILILNIILFTSIASPFYTVSTYYNILVEEARKYIATQNIYISFGEPAEYGRIYSYVSIEPARIYINQDVIDVYSYGFTNLTGLRSLTGVNIDRLGDGECILGRYIAVKYGVRPRDTIKVGFRDSVREYIVRGLSNTLPLITEYRRDSMYGLVVYKSSNLYQGGEGFRLGSIDSFLDELRRQAVGTLSLWLYPVYILTLLGSALITYRFRYDIHRDLKTLYVGGLSRWSILKHLIICLIPIIASAVLVGLSLGLVVSQVLSRVLYTVTYRISITPEYSLVDYLETFTTFTLSSLVGVVGILGRRIEYD